MDVMVIAPHPDDAEIGMGGTILGLLAQGCEVGIVDLTDGEPTPFGSKEIREKETAAASDLLGVKKRVQLDIKNREVFDTVANRNKLGSVIREHKPEILFIPYWEDGHPDHIEACKLCESARFYSKFVKSDMAHEPHHPRKVFHYFSTHIRVKLNPSFVFNITDHLETKLGALRAYESQFLSNPKNTKVFDMVRDAAAYWGQQVGVTYGEPFACRENLRVSSAKSLVDF